MAMEKSDLRVRSNRRDHGCEFSRDLNDAHDLQVFAAGGATPKGGLRGWPVQGLISFGLLLFVFLHSFFNSYLVREK
jgi:hypothetical protein